MTVPSAPYGYPNPSNTIKLIIFLTLVVSNYV